MLFQSLSQSNDKIKNIFKEEENKMKVDKKYKVSKNKKIEIKNNIKKY